MSSFDDLDHLLDDLSADVDYLDARDPGPVNRKATRRDYVRAFIWLCGLLTAMLAIWLWVQEI